MAEIALARPLDEVAALDWLRSQPGRRINLPAAELGRRWGWQRDRTGRRLKAWAEAGLLTRHGNIITVTDVSVTPPNGPVARPVRVTGVRARLVTPSAGLELAAYLAAVGAHMGERGAAQSAIGMQDAALAARIDVQAHTVTDLDRRLGQIDSAIEEAAKRGRTTTALTAFATQRKRREALVEQRRAEASTLADLKAERSALGAKGQQIETEAAPFATSSNSSAPMPTASGPYGGWH
jgi:hypothetical protein